ncbi:hypothetical protein IJF86_00285 [Candidatus Saccharibacteria bacterium]|nr:hypothetical protein [Candidatus Saccharibacteria bacterium]
MTKNSTLEKISLKTIEKDILAEARVLGIHTGFAAIIADKTLKKVEAYLSSHPVVTEVDLNRIIATELKKYNKDLAYIYHNRDKII